MRAMKASWLRPLLAGGTVAALSVIGELLPLTGVLPPPTGYQPFSVVRVAEDALWVAVAAVAAARPMTLRFAALVVLSSFTDLVWALGYLGNDALYFLAEEFKGIDTVVFATLIVTFPTGRLRDRFDRAFVGGLLAYFFILGTIQLLAFQPGYACDPGTFCPVNPFAVWPSAGLYDTIGTVSGFLVPVIGLGVIASVVRHWRAATPVGRRILRPVLIALPFEYAIISFGYVAQALDRADLAQLTNEPVLLWSTWLLPGAFLIGVLQTRLARSAVADLAVQVGAGIPLGGLRDALARALRDPSLELGFPAPDGHGPDDLVDADGRPFALPAPGARRAVTRIERDGALLAVLVHDPEIDAEDPGLIERVAAVARLALENERLSAQVRAQLEEVRASRARIVEAADAERRRVERDLHDGAQQRLVALGMRLELARESQTGASALIDQTTAELTTAIAEVRGLARGLHPPILTEAGLAAALESLAERSPIPVRVDAPEDRYAPAVEAAAYFVVAEALTNVAKYSGASSATVTVRPTNGGLSVQVTDDGRGGADPDRGSGLRGLTDRVAAIGGRLTIQSPTGGGTTVLAELPTT
jgi:signal transduction histidine kinase